MLIDIFYILIYNCIHCLIQYYIYYQLLQHYNTTKENILNTKIRCSVCKPSFYIVVTLLVMIVLLWGCNKDINDLATNIDNMECVVAEDETDDPTVVEDTVKSTQESHDSYIEETEKPNNYAFILSFAGDINFDENWSTMAYYNTTTNGIYDCISPDLIQMMNDSDIMSLNNEFTFSTQGVSMEGKAYTFRAHPSRVGILKELGVDIVNLANNHVYDYGEQALLDTMDTLTKSDIYYFGAGKNLENAMAPVYFEVQGKTIAYVGASRAEKYQMTPQATENSPGILRCYDTSLFIETIKEAKNNADYVIANVHWGTEYSYELEDIQLQTSKDYIDAGADVIIGAHPHVLQGIEYYKGKPIVYSLGNLWFNEKTLDTMLLNIHFNGNDNEESIELEIIPAIQSENVTKLVTKSEEKERIYSFLEDISINVEINKQGLVTEISN